MMRSLLMVGRLSNRNIPEVSAPIWLSSPSSRSPFRSLPRTPMHAHRAPSVSRSAATDEAPPPLYSRRTTLSTCTGASGLIRSASP